MARPTDTGFLKGFDATLFRQAITSTMEMGLPENVNERITFRWNPETTYETADQSGIPFDFTEEPLTEEITADVQVPAAIEFSNLREDGTPLGQFEQPQVIATLLDIHYEQVKGADEALIGENTYAINFVAPPVGLGEVTIYRIYMRAVDEA